VGKQHFYEEANDDGRARDARKYCQEKDNRHDRNAVAGQQISSAAEPAEKGHQVEQVEENRTVRAPASSMSVAEVKMTEMKMAKAREREDAQCKSKHEADQVQQFPVHWETFPFLDFGAGVAALGCELS